VKEQAYARKDVPRQSPQARFPHLPDAKKIEHAHEGPLSSCLCPPEVMTMERRKQGPETVSPLYRRRVDPKVEERRRVIVALLRQYPDGLTAREIGEATGIAKNLTASALSGLFTRGVLHKRGHCYVLAAQEDAIDRSQKG